MFANFFPEKEFLTGCHDYSIGLNKMKTAHFKKIS